MSIGSDELADYLARTNLTLDRILNKEASRISYNVAPTTTVPVYRQEYQRHDNNGMQSICELQYMRWGVIPSWSKECPLKSSSAKTFNCRSDKLKGHHGLWASLKNTKRCVAIADGYYEWKTIGSIKIPYFVKNTNNSLLFFAALWDLHIFEGKEVYSFTIITHDSKGPLQKIHHRAPTTIQPDSQNLKTWLDPSIEWNDQLQRIADQSIENECQLEFYEVSDEVGRVTNNYEKLQAPVKYKKSTGLLDNFFFKDNNARHSSSRLPCSINPSSENTDHERRTITAIPLDDKSSSQPVVQLKKDLEENSRTRNEASCENERLVGYENLLGNGKETSIDYEGIKNNIELFQDITSREQSDNHDGLLQELFHSIQKSQLDIQSSIEVGKGSIDRLLWLNDLINEVLENIKVHKTGFSHSKRSLDTLENPPVLLVKK
ncbi:DUF159-domain-containing protein [Nadsonia fulvescens var. elongata DSM 6958]|uniref:DUF159-domain-containing protein n=1 Tax=Nadsonia fulvescens var. elongata DSM 6958 TaxID=857566 RepID=A0A1E3PR30_9ASCO|nr:DUF159-domain-containing protein [Nadsonia fulvescens var. elongata DSM 6958]